MTVCETTKCMACMARVVICAVVTITLNNRKVVDKYFEHCAICKQDLHLKLSAGAVQP